MSVECFRRIHFASVPTRLLARANQHQPLIFILSDTCHLIIFAIATFAIHHSFVLPFPTHNSPPVPLYTAGNSFIRLSFVCCDYVLYFLMLIRFLRNCRLFSVFRPTGVNHCTDLVRRSGPLRPEKFDPNRPTFGHFRSENPQNR